MKDVFRIAVLALALGLVLALIFVLEGLVAPAPGGVFCNASRECEDLSHDECEGEWACLNHYCSWECEEPPDTSCVTASDCEDLDLPHIMCEGEWVCQGGECSWACEVGSGEPELEYEVGECEEGVRMGNSLEIFETANGMRMEQVLDYVCCADIELEMEIEGNLIRITEVNEGEMCKCMCSYEIEAETSLLPGTYKVEVYGVEHEGQPIEKLGEARITVGKKEGRVLFVEQHKNTYGELIAGDYPFMFIDFPTYFFNEKERVLDANIDVESEDMLLVYGSGESLSGDAGSGAATGLSPVYSIPAKVSGDKIARVWDDGTVALEHAGEVITLAPGQSWEDVETNQTSRYNIGLIELTVTDRVVNHGFVEFDNSGI